MLPKEVKVRLMSRGFTLKVDILGIGALVNLAATCMC